MSSYFFYMVQRSPHRVQHLPHIESKKSHMNPSTRHMGRLVFHMDEAPGSGSPLQNRARERLHSVPQDEFI